MIDTHCHLAFRDFAPRVDEVIADAARAGVNGMITVCTTAANAHANLAIANAHDNVWCTAGVHPLHADEPTDWKRIREVAAEPKCVAWGELGLDCHYDRPPMDVQYRVLEEQLAMIESAHADGLILPIVVHCRKAVDELLPIFRNASFDPTRYVFHCFTGSPADARKILDFGATMSFTGIVTFPNASEVAEASDLVPLDRIMVETDSPFLTPIPHRGKRPNEPKYVPHVAAFIARRRGIPTREFNAQLDANAIRFFGLQMSD